MSFIHSILSTRIEDTHSFSFCRSRGTRVRAARSESHPFPPALPIRESSPHFDARVRARPLAPPHPVARARTHAPRAFWRHERSRRVRHRVRSLHECIVRAGLFHEFRMGSRRRTLPSGDGLAHPGRLSHHALRVIQRSHPRSDVARSRRLGDHRRGRRPG